MRLRKDGIAGPNAFVAVASEAGQAHACSVLVAFAEYACLLGARLVTCGRVRSYVARPAGAPPLWSYTVGVVACRLALGFTFGCPVEDGELVAFLADANVPGAQFVGGA